MTGSERAKLMWKLAELIEANRDELAELESLNNGKPIVNIRHSDIAKQLRGAALHGRLGHQAHRRDHQPRRSPAISTPIRCASRSAWSGRSFPGTRR